MITEQTWRRTELLQMLTIDSHHSHVASQVFGKVRHVPVDVFLWQLFPDSLPSAG